MRITKAVFINRAPFEKLVIDFKKSAINVLSGINGKGKTTVISYIVDSLYELAKKGFPNEFAGKENKYYRVSSGLYSIDPTMPSIVYLRYEVDGEELDYIDVRGECTEEQYNSLVLLSNNIQFNEIKNIIQEEKNVKYWRIKDNKKAINIFNKGIYTYFPAYRYETPNYLNEPYQVSLKFKTESNFSGYLQNPIEVISDLPRIANWIMDVVLDGQIYQGESSMIQTQINNVFNSILISKTKVQTRIGIGPRQNGSQRIAIMDRMKKTQMYPSIFAMSSGELTLVCLFIELIKQADKIGRTPSGVEGIVLIDEIDKHLHIKLQKEVLPSLLSLFPNIQFIVTSHAPFFSIGLDRSGLRYKIFDFDNDGIECLPYNNELFEEVYDLLISENNRFAKKYNDLLYKIKSDTKPLIITEGKTDWQHLKAALNALQIKDFNVEFYEYDEALGDKALLRMLKEYSRFKQHRIIIGIFDRDNATIVNEIDNKSGLYFSFGNNVFGFCIPIVNENEYGSKVSIEHYYHKNDLLKEDENKRRLFLGSEFYSSGNSVNGKYRTKCSGIQTKIDHNGIIDEKVYLSDDLKEEKSIALSKAQFALNILNKKEYAKDFDFSEFNRIFNIIKDVIDNNTIE